MKMIISQQQFHQIRQPEMIRLTLLCLFSLACSQVSAEEGTEAIVGGHYARKGDFKYHVSIIFEGDKCGGAIIGDHFVLTAAHCVTNNSNQIIMERFTIIAGTIDQHNHHGSIVIPVETVFIPKNYSRVIHLHDIAVLKLKHSLNISHHRHKLEKVNLPRPDKLYANTCAVITGFGDQEIRVQFKHGKWEEFGGISDGKLKFANVRVVTSEKCKEMNGRVIPPTNLCGQLIQSSKNSFEGVCNGDSGGPLVYGNEIIGVISLSPTGCNESRRAATYTRVSSYLHFINSVIRGHPGPDVAWAHVPH